MVGYIPGVANMKILVRIPTSKSVIRVTAQKIFKFN